MCKALAPKVTLNPQSKICLGKGAVLVGRGECARENCGGEEVVQVLRACLCQQVGEQTPFGFEIKNFCVFFLPASGGGGEEL